MSALKGTRCKSCGRPIAFVSDTEGTTHPLELVAPVYHVVEGPGGAPLARRAENHYVSHFATCPQASEHSRAGGAKRGRVTICGGSTYDERETLKRWGLRWDVGAKEWWIDLEDERIDPCCERLRELCPDAHIETREAKS